MVHQVTHSYNDAYMRLNITQGCFVGHTRNSWSLVGLLVGLASVFQGYQKRVGTINDNLTINLIKLNCCRPYFSHERTDNLKELNLVSQYFLIRLNVVYILLSLSGYTNILSLRKWINK